MTTPHATAVASANIAFIKYWGNVDPTLRLPFNASLSMNLSDATTTTGVHFDPDSTGDCLTIDGVSQTGPSLERVTTHLDHIRRRAGMSTRAAVTSTNTFPMGTGIASSASGFAALTVAAAAAAGLALDERELSALARLGSGSAARSVPGGFVAWRTGSEHADSYAWSVAPPDHWDLHDVVAVVSRDHKAVGSGGGHAAALTSPLYAARLAGLQSRYDETLAALMERDLARFGAKVEAEALELHAIALTSRPHIIYWSPATVALLLQVARWRDQGLPVYFTLDAGPNVHLLCRGTDAAALTAELRALDYVETWLDNRPAGPARLIPVAA